MKRFPAGYRKSENSNFRSSQRDCGKLTQTFEGSAPEVLAEFATIPQQFEKLEPIQIFVRFCENRNANTTPRMFRQGAPNGVKTIKHALLSTFPWSKWS